MVIHGRHHVHDCRYCGTGEAFDNIYVERDIATWEDLDERLRRMEHFIQNPPGPPLRLVVVDSVAHLFSDNADFQTGMSSKHVDPQPCMCLQALSNITLRLHVGMLMY